MTVKKLLTRMRKQTLPLAPGLEDMFDPLTIEKGKKKRAPLSTDDLKAIFESREYREGLFDHTSMFWVPLLTLHGIGRQAEPCQLMTDDVFREEGCWCVSINDDQEGSRLKTVQTRRTLPIHRKLIDLGFIDYVNQVRKDNPGKNVPLFPEEERNPLGHYDRFSKRINRWIKGKGIKPTNGMKKDFYSLRHNFITQLGRLRPGVPSYIYNAITGHAKENEAENTRTYLEGVTIKQKADYIFKVRYPGVHFDKIGKDAWRRAYARSRVELVKKSARPILRWKPGGLVRTCPNYPETRGN
jgi:hypothetical protein